MCLSGVHFTCNNSICHNFTCVINVCTTLHRTVLYSEFVKYHSKGCRLVYYYHSQVSTVSDDIRPKDREPFVSYVVFWKPYDIVEFSRSFA